MRKWVITALLVWLGAGVQSQPLAFTRAVALSHDVASLEWRSVPGASSYDIYRQYPGASFSLLASVADTFFLDTIRRTICSDTVVYRVAALPADSACQNSAGVYFHDSRPTAPCLLRTCSVDTALRRIRLTWYPSPDTDIMGYHICQSLAGGPCVVYDTVWGRLSTSFLCSERVDEHAPEYAFRILAFDSCFQASPLTPYYHNIGLHFDDPGCSRRFAATFTGYENMPDSVAAYLFRYRLGGDTLWHQRRYSPSPSGTYRFDTLIADLSVASVYCYVCACSRNDSLFAFSAASTFRFSYGDTAQYVSLLQAEYDEIIPAVHLIIDADPAFPGRWCHIYRRSQDSLRFTLIDSVDRSDASDGMLRYDDTRIGSRDTLFAYRVGIADLCHQWVKLSDSLSVAIPPVPEPQAWLPNVIVAGDPERGLFCPHFSTVLAADYTLDIFNRFGQQIFHSDDVAQCWDGTYRGSFLPQGVYVYRIRCRHGDNTVRTYIGNILILQ